MKQKLFVWNEMKTLRHKFRSVAVRNTIEKNGFNVVPTHDNNYRIAFSASRIPGDSKIYVRQLKRVYFIWSSGPCRRGVLFLDEAFNILDLSNMVPAEVIDRHTVSRPDKKSIGVLAFDKYTGGNMCHVVFDHLCRAHEAASLGFRRECVFFVDSAWDWAKRLTGSFFGCFNALRANHLYYFDELYFYSNAFEGKMFHPSIQLSQSFASALHRFCQHLGTTDNGYPKKLYQNRLSTNVRTIANERSLISALEKKGYHSFDTARMSLANQLACFHAADQVIAPHGAGLSNMIACHDAAVIAEIFCGSSTNAYQIIAETLALDYTGITPVATRGDAGTTIDVNQCLDILDAYGF